MKNTIKLAAIGAAALAVSSTSALALSELPAGITTGLALGAPLPEGVYDITIGSYGSRNSTAFGNLSYALPVWLIWSTPWQIAGGRIAFNSTTAIADVWTNGTTGTDSFLNTLVEGSIAWNLGNTFGGGWNASLRAGAWLPSDQTLVKDFARDYTAFMGGGSISYVANGWNLTATALYGSGNDGKVYSLLNAPQNDWVNLDITATKKFGKYETGVVAYGSWDVEGKKFYNSSVTLAKQDQFAIGGLVGYDFGSFIAQFKLTTDVEAHNVIGAGKGALGDGGVLTAGALVGNEKETRATLTIIKPLWSPAADVPLK